MRIFNLFIFLILIISCSDKISEFDKVLGEENVETLEFLVSDFENDFLKRQYPNLDTENAYRQFLTELREGKTENWKRISNKTKNKFKSSDLINEIYEFPDSVWVLKNSTFDKIESDSLGILYSPGPYIKSRYKYINPDGTTKYTFSRSYGIIRPDANFDSIIKREQEIPNMNFTGKYMQALASIKDKNEFYKELYETKESVGLIFPSTTARIMLKFDIDLNDKLNRKIIALELAY